MWRFNSGVSILAIMLVAGCAGAPSERIAAGAGQDAVEAAETTAPELLAAESGAEASALASSGEAIADIEPDLVVDAIDPAPESEVVCREMLKQGSNVIIRQCMTRENWERFKRRQARDAQAVVRMLQGGAYR